MEVRLEGSISKRNTGALIQIIEKHKETNCPTDHN